MNKSTEMIAAALALIGVINGPTGAGATEKDIIDTAVAAGQFKTFAAALYAVNLVSTLRGVGPFTVFAPTDEAFAKLPPGAIQNLLRPENKDRLTAILTYHLVPGRVMAADVVSLQTVETSNGRSFAIRQEAGGVMVNDAKVTATDIQAGNGVIHVIDAVILPP
jgi:uncharacterized surface protein with fasciclin (FAS1) repeats